MTYYAVFQSDPEVFVTAVADDATGAELTGKGAGKFVAGTVTGMGKYAAGKKVALKATANKGYVFRGWYGVPSVAVPSVLSVPSVSSVPYVPFDDPTAVDGCELLSMAATYTLAAMPTNDVELTAAFITANLDKAHIAASVDGFALAPWVSKTETHAFATNVWAGVYLEWPVAASALSETTVKVTGLPSGLKFTDKPVTTKSTSGTGQAKVTTVVTNIPANTIYGAPIAASKTTTDKNTGMTTVTPSAVMVTVATAGKSTQTYQIDTTVDPLPERVQGTFFGGSTNAPFAGSANVTVAASGKISGKWISDGKTWTLAANCFDRYDEEYDAFVVDLAAKAGKETGRFPLVVTPDGLAKSEGGIALGWANWKVEPWKTLGKSFDKRVFAYAIKADGSFSSSDADVVSPLGDDFVGKVMLTFAANGTAKIAGEFVTGYDARKSKFTTVKVTGSSTLVPQEDGSCLVFVYLAPKGLAPHARCVEVISIMD